METTGNIVGDWWTHGFMVYSTSTVGIDQTLWWSMVDGLNHGFTHISDYNTVFLWER